MMNKKLCIAYNVFDGTEHLEPSINQIRQFADKIIVIFQKTSNFGLPVEQVAIDTVADLLKRGIIDEVIEYQPKDFGSINNPYLNEMAKRQLGLDRANFHGCAFYSVMDCDEYYLTEEYEKYFEQFAASDCDASVANMLTYYHDNQHVLEPPETYYVPVWYRLSDNSQFVLACDFPVLVDPTRRIPSKKVMIFDKERFVMHHQSYVRKNFESKFVNSSSRVGFNNAIGHVRLADKLRFSKEPNFAGVHDSATNILIHYLIDYLKNWDDTKPAKTILTGITDWRTRKVEFWKKITHLSSK